MAALLMNPIDRPSWRARRPRRARLTLEELETRAVPAQIQFSAGVIQVNEGQPATVTVTRQGDLSKPSTVNFATSDGSGQAGVDYTPVAGTLNFGAGQNSKTFTVPTIQDFKPGTDSKTVTLTLSNQSAGDTLGAPSAATVLVVEIDPGLIGSATPLGNAEQTPQAANQVIGVGTVDQMYSFTAQAGQTIRFDVVHLQGTPLDSILRLFDAAGNQLAFNDDGLTLDGVATRDAALVYTFDVAGTYFVGISGYPNFGYNAMTGSGAVNGSIGIFSLKLSPTAAPADTNDQTSEALPLASPSRVRRVNDYTISAATDVDMFRFSGRRGQQVSIVVGIPTGSKLAPRLRLFNSLGKQIATTVGRSGRAAIVTATLATGGTFYIGVSGQGNSSYNAVTGDGDTAGSTGGYTLAVAPGRLRDADHNARLDDAARLGALSRARSAASGLSTPADVDIFSFTAASGQRVAFEASGHGGALEPFLRLFDANGVELASSPGRARAGRPARLDFAFLVAGSYFVGVSSHGASYDPVTGTVAAPGKTFGTYRLSAVPKGTTTPAIGPGAPATPLPYGASAPAVGGLVFFDQSGDGQLQPSETGESDHLIILDLNRNGVRDDGEAAALSNAQGQFLMHARRSGRFPIAVVAVDQFGIPVEKINGPRQGFFDLDLTARHAVVNLAFGLSRYLA